MGYPGKKNVDPDKRSLRPADRYVHAFYIVQTQVKWPMGSEKCSKLKLKNATVR
jgi:hypothetical protein